MAKNDPNRFLLPFEKSLTHVQRQIAELEAQHAETGRDFSANIQQLREQETEILSKTYAKLSAWETVQVARHPNRPLGMDYVERVVKNFFELHGDRRFHDDLAIRCGLGQIGTEKALVVVQNKGRDTKDKIACNFGCAHPEGYRKAQRTMKMAEKFSLPVVVLIDTQGAYPGVGSEERGVAEAIARNMLEMSRLKTPIVCVVIGEGGSGGALGVGVGDRVAMLEFAYYSVISPEGCASILWRTGEKAPEAAEALKLTSKHLKKLGVVDDVIAEPLGGAHRKPAEAATNLERYVVRALRQLKKQPIDQLLEARYERWRQLGHVTEAVQDAQEPPASDKAAS